MIIKESIEEIKEIREVTVTMGFEFINGKLANPKDEEIYNLVAPIGDELVEEVEKAIDKEMEEHTLDFSNKRH